MLRLSFAVETQKNATANVKSSVDRSPRRVLRFFKRGTANKNLVARHASFGISHSRDAFFEFPLAMVIGIGS